MALPDGMLVVAGLRGSTFYSEDGGRTWSAAETNTKSSVTSIAEIRGRIVAVGLDGTFMISHDRGRHFQAIRLAALEGRATLNSVLASEDDRALLFSEQGPLAVALPGSSAIRQP